MDNIVINKSIKCRHVLNDTVDIETNPARYSLRADWAQLFLRMAGVITAILLLNGVTLAEPADVSQRYSNTCSVCHGDRGQGALHAQQGMIPAPKNFTDPVFIRTMTRERIIAAIHNGKPGTAMIAWQSVFSDDEIAELADYIIGNFMTPADAQMANEESVQDAHETITIYQESCSVCHGDDGTGAVWGQESLSAAPRDFTSDAARRELTRDRMIAAVTYGRPGSPMPGFGSQLNPAQIENVVDYIRDEFIAGRAGDVTGPGGDYHQQPYASSLTGHFERGRAFYMSNCVTCHGVAGDGDGPRAYFIFPPPRNFLDPATQQILNRPTLFRGIKDGVIGKEMPAWGKVMNDQDIADIAEYVYLEFIRNNQDND